MREIQVEIDPSRADEVLRLASEHEARSPVRFRVDERDKGERERIVAHLPNDRVGAFVEAVRGLTDDVVFRLFPQGTLSVRAPVAEVGEEVKDVSRLSTAELVLSSLQSIGSWRGMLVYSVLAGVVGGYGVIFDVSYLLVAAMLINPMGAPAMVAVIGASVGAARMFGRGALRFVASLAIQAASALALGLAYGLQISTPMMEQITSLSSWALVVALAAGAAGAQSLVLSDRDSLVSGTAAGFMVAAALAPPAAVLGLSLAVARTDYTGVMALLLSLQFVAIILGGWAALRLHGVRPAEPSVGRGSAAVRTATLVGVALGCAALVGLQLRLGPTFTKADLSREALEITRHAIDAVPAAYLVEADARFTRADLERLRGREALLVDVVVERAPIAEAAEVETAVRRAIEAGIRARITGVTPFVRVDVLPPSAPLPGPPSAHRPPPGSSALAD
jgi:uncharacterized hydrophobic protein (TIGR00271 family)